MRNEGKKEAAILFLDKILKRNGGPSTYLYNLRQGLWRLHNNEIRFISVRSPQKCVTADLMNLLHKKMLNEKRSIITYFIFQLVYILNDIDQKIHMRRSIIDACKYQVVHVHHVEDAVALKVLGKYNGTIILTMHTPEPWSDEVIHSLQSRFPRKNKFIIIWLYQHVIEKLACYFADAFLFPSKEAEDMYLKFDFYKKSRKEKKVDYLLTGTIDNAKKYEKEKIRAEFGVPKDKFVLLFVGRHNRIKGYDMLVDNQKLLQEKGVYVVCVGMQNELCPQQESPMWKELGWQKNIYQLYDMADAVILPNRETYFDLAAIEALSRGKILIASATGGNNTLANLSDGVILFKSSDIQDMIRKIVYVMEMEKKKKAELERKNRCCYLENFTIEKFASSYITFFEKYM